MIDDAACIHGWINACTLKFDAAGNQDQSCCRKQGHNTKWLSKAKSVHDALNSMKFHITIGLDEV